VIVVVCPGTGTFTGATFNASGANNSGSNPKHGGGGGTIKIAIRELVTDGAYHAAGGDGEVITGSNDGAGGGGGTAYVVTSQAVAGSLTYDVTGGANGNSGLTGEAGVSGTVVLASSVEWDDLRTQGFFGR
jgi:hypothetical protein